jgi:hypothetical protein
MSLALSGELGIVGDDERRASGELKIDGFRFLSTLVQPAMSIIQMRLVARQSGCVLRKEMNDFRKKNGTDLR